MRESRLALECAAWTSSPIERPPRRDRPPRGAGPPGAVPVRHRPPRRRRPGRGGIGGRHRPGAGRVPPRPPGPGAGLLIAEYRRLSGRTGPVRRAPGQALPTLGSTGRGHHPGAPRRPAGAGSSRWPSTPTAWARIERVRAGARGPRVRRGPRQDARGRAGPRPSRARLTAAALAILADSGFEPLLDGATIVLRNCPFDRVARDHRDLVCGMNRSIMDGLVTGLRSSGLQAAFDPQSGRCCMTFQTAAAPAPSQPPSRRRSRSRIAASSSGSAWSQPHTWSVPWVTRRRSSSAADQRTSPV